MWRETKIKNSKLQKLFQNFVNKTFKFKERTF